MLVHKVRERSRHLLARDNRLNGLPRPDAGQRVHVAAVFQFLDHKTARQCRDPELEPEVKKPHRLKVDEHIGILDGDLHAFSPLVCKGLPIPAA